MGLWLTNQPSSHAVAYGEIRIRRREKFSRLFRTRAGSNLPGGASISSMKTTRFLCLFTLMTLMGALVVQAQPNATSSVGLTNYFDRASLELRHLRNSIEATVEVTPLAGQPQLAPYLNALVAAEQSLAAFKTASTSEFDRRQMEFEQAKAKAVSFWETYRLPRREPAVQAAPSPSPAESSE